MEPPSKHPAKLRTPWPPAEPQLKKQVTTADNWVSLAAPYKFDPWDIIYYNFHTYDPLEVNWYLKNWLGCRATVNGGRDYAFAREVGNRAPIELYIPKSDYLAPGPHQAAAKRVVLAVLGDSVALNLAFKLGSFELRAGDLQLVAQAIRSQKIYVKHRPKAGNMAYYIPGNPYNSLLVSYDKLPDIGSRALIVHECVHAVCDIRKLPLAAYDNELVAYVAQALYMRYSGWKMDGGVGASALPATATIVDRRNAAAWSGIFANAGALAEAIYTGKDFSTLDFLGAKLSMLFTDTYANASKPWNDGI